MDTFLQTHELFEAHDPPAPSEVPGNIPNQLGELLRKRGANAYADGFFRFVLPQVFGPYFELVHLEPSECFSFLKCGFGQLLFYHQQQYKTLDPVFNTVDVIGDAEELDFVMDIALCDRAALESAFMIDVYEEAFPRLGAPDVDEMYAFVPALRLGGGRSAANVHKSKMAVQMPMLLQL
jgi:hypothetical protein